jgi:hypothetical protein
MQSAEQIAAIRAAKKNHLWRINQEQSWEKGLNRRGEKWGIMILVLQQLMKYGNEINK